MLILNHQYTNKIIKTFFKGEMNLPSLKADLWLMTDGRNEGKIANMKAMSVTSVTYLLVTYLAGDLHEGIIEMI